MQLSLLSFFLTPLLFFAFVSDAKVLKTRFIQKIHSNTNTQNPLSSTKKKRILIAAVEGPFDTELAEIENAEEPDFEGEDPETNFDEKDFEVLYDDPNFEEVDAKPGDDEKTIEDAKIESEFDNDDADIAFDGDQIDEDDAIEIEVVDDSMPDHEFIGDTTEGLADLSEDDILPESADIDDETTDSDIEALTEDTIADDESFDQQEMEFVDDGENPDYELVDDAPEEGFPGDDLQNEEAIAKEEDTLGDEESATTVTKKEIPEEGFSVDDDTIAQEDDTLADDTTSEEDLTLDEATTEKVAAATDTQALNLITNIRYLSNEDQIVIDCSEPTSYQVRTNEQTKQFIVEILQAKLAENLHWPYPFRDFKTNFGLMKADQKDKSTVRVIVQLKKEAKEFPVSTLTEESDQILIGYGEVMDYKIVKKSSKPPGPILPPKTLEDFYFGEMEFHGSPLSFFVNEVPVRQVLSFISEESGLNMVIDEDVKGNVTLKLEDVPWDLALYEILKVKSLGYTRKGTVVTILPLEKLEARIKKIKEITDRQKSLRPYETKAITLNYRQVSEIETKIKDFLSTEVEGISKGGQIISQAENNLLIVTDTPEVIKKVEALIQHLDTPPQQVMVEAKVVEASKNFNKNFGLTWSLSGDAPVNITFNGLLDFLGNLGANYGASFETGEDAGLKANFDLYGLPAIGDLGASLSLAEVEGQARVISSPKIIVLSGRPANITRNAPVLVPSSTTTTTQGDTTQSFTSTDVQLTLNVTPTVTPKGSIFLKVNVTKSDPGSARGATHVTRTAQTEVLVKNGQTIVIGGLYEEGEKIDKEGIPWLNKIPVLGMLFGTKTISRNNAELLVFITPKLLDSHS